jgi:Zn-dependent peptidase ImmA (M78 family)
MVDIQINGKMLLWAIQDSRTTPALVEEKCHFASGVVQGWINGDDQPNTGELRKIASALGRSLQFFLRPEPPTSVTIDARFRRSLHSDSAEPEKEVMALRLAHRAQQFARWADDSVSSSMLPATPNEDAASYAARLSSHLGWTLTNQRRATSKSAVFRALRQRTEALGALVILQPAGRSNFRGFSLAGDPPLIFVNKDYGGAALRTFTLLHELAHLGAGTGDRSCYYEDTKQERWCNQVATEFLLPRARFTAYVESKGFARVTDRDVDDLRLISQYFNASWLAVAIRLKEIGRADDSLVDFVRTNFLIERDPPAAITGVDRSTPVIRTEEFGGNYIRFIRKAVEDSRITELEAGKMLRANSRQLASLWQLTAEAG